MSVLSSAKRWWQTWTGKEETPLDGDTPAWVMSLVIHIGVLLTMALVGIQRPEPSHTAITILAPSQAVEEDLLVAPEMTLAEERESAASAETTTIDIAMAVAPVVADDPTVLIDVAEVVGGEIAVAPIDMAPTGAELGEFLEVGRLGAGDTGVGTAGAGGAVDRLTVEIAASLQQRPTVVCWVFDQSVSLAGQRQEIAGRLGRVFEELGGTGRESHGHELLNLVFAYGQKVTPVITEPTQETAPVVAAIESIPVDELGVEMTFTAIAEAAKKAKQVRVSPTKRNVMIIAFTDEVGNDQQYADQVAAYCRTQAMRVYVVGVPAPFGMRDVRIKFKEFDPKYADDVQWAVVEQGPETLYPEMVRVRSGRDGDEPIDSGFGPFSLSKLCAETGGIYFCVHANRQAGGRVGDGEVADMASGLRYFFDPEVMRAYRPDYQSAAKIDQLLASNRAMKSLVDAARSPTGGQPTARIPPAEDRRAVRHPRGGASRPREGDREAVAGRLRSGDRPGARGEGADRCLQHHAGRGEDGDEVQGPEERHVAAGAERRHLDGRLADREGGRAGREVSAAGGGRASWHAMGPDRRRGAWQAPGLCLARGPHRRQHAEERRWWRERPPE